MSTKINQASIGLQALLGTQSFGDNPDALSQVAIPSVDLLPFLGAHRVQSTRGSASRSLAGFASVVTVPEGEHWLPIYLSGGMLGMNALDIGTPMTIAVSLRIRSKSAGTAFTSIVFEKKDVVDELTAGGGSAVYLGGFVPNSFLLGPGSTVETYCDQISSVNAQSYETIATYYRLKT